MKWGLIPGFSQYLISEEGEILSFKGKQCRLMTKFRRCGYPAVTLIKDGHKKGKVYQVHSLILKAFVGPRPVGQEGCHNDSNPENCKLSNLRWDTRKGNQADREAAGTKSEGEKSGMAVLTEAQAQEIVDAIPTWKRGMGAEFARRFGVVRSQVNLIKRRKAWKHL